MNPQPQGPQPPMYTPDQMRAFPFLTDAEKEKYEKGLRGLYEALHKFGPETPNHQNAKSKIVEFSRMVHVKVQNQRAQQRAQQQGAQAGGATQQAQAAQATTGQPQNATAAAQGQRTTTAGQRPPGAPGPAANGQIGATANSAGGAPGQPAQQRTSAVPPQIQSHVNSFIIHPPPSIAQKGKEAVSQWVTEYRNKYTRALVIMEVTKKNVQQIDNVIKGRQAQGKPVEEEELKSFNDKKEAEQKSHNDAMRFVHGFRQQQEQLKTAAAAAAAATASGQPPRPQQGPGGAAMNAGSNPAMQAATGQVNAAMDAAKNQQFAAAAAAANRQAALGGQQLPQNGPVGVGAAQPAAAGPQASAVPATQAPIKAEPGSQPQAPLVNTNVGNAHLPSGAPAQGANVNGAAGRVQTPQNATPVTATGGAKPLSHSAALSLANRQNSSSSVPPSAGPNQPGAAAANSTPSSATMPGNAGQSGHSHGHPTPNTAMQQQTKMPIPKTLPENATKVPQPVALGGGVQPGRPTMSAGTGIAGGGMSQPAISKMSALHFESEGEHVIKKKKLDELVRQVCGGGQPGPDGNYLTPDVEESLLNVADNFVDNVIYYACRMAKARGSKVLEIRDIQLVLERTYNIRVPGYTSDELRTVRKIQPSAGWIGKMSAIQAAKIAPGKDDK